MATTPEPLSVLQAHYCKTHSPKVGVLQARLTPEGWVAVCPFHREYTRCDIVAVTVTVTEIIEGGQ